MKCKVNIVKWNGKQLCSVLNLDYICKLMLKQFKIMVNCIPNILLMFSLPSYAFFSHFGDWMTGSPICTVIAFHNTYWEQLSKHRLFISFVHYGGSWEGAVLYKLCWFGAFRFSLEISKHRIVPSKSECFGKFGNITLPFL